MQLSREDLKNLVFTKHKHMHLSSKMSDGSLMSISPVILRKVLHFIYSEMHIYLTDIHYKTFPKLCFQETALVQICKTGISCM